MCLHYFEEVFFASCTFIFDVSISSLSGQPVAFNHHSKVVAADSLLTALVALGGAMGLHALALVCSSITQFLHRITSTLMLHDFLTLQKL